MQASNQDGCIGKHSAWTLQKHIEITTKLYKNHNLEPPEIQLNRGPITKDKKKKPHRDWYQGQKYGMSWSHTQVWQSKSEVSPEEQGVSPTPGPTAEVSGKQVPLISGCENKLGLWLSETEDCCNFRNAS